jgi:hypothetical protein
MIELLPLAARSEIGTKAQIVAVIVAGIFLGVVLELVRRRRLVERYALLWMLGAVALLVLAVWRGALGGLADLIGVISPPNALFLIALGVIFVLLLHFSIATSRLSEETKILAQEVARLDAEARAARGALVNGGGASGPPSQAPQAALAEGEPPAQPTLAEREPPSSATTSDQ